MKITILPADDGEEEIIIKCNALTREMLKALEQFRGGINQLALYKGNEIRLMDVSEIYYFESVDNVVFAYCKDEVYETKSRLHELEEKLSMTSFMRSSKSMIINLNKIESLSPIINGRFQALLKNKEKVMISRQYVGKLKEKLGL